MPARIRLSRSEIQEAIRSRGGNLGLAARDLNISVKTLRRRIAEDPSLRPKANPLDLLKPTWLELAAVTTDTNRLITFEHWRPERSEAIPKVLSLDETRELARVAFRMISSEFRRRGLSLRIRDRNHSEEPKRR